MEFDLNPPCEGAYEDALIFQLVQDMLSQH